MSFETITRVEDISAGWLSAILQRNYPGIVVGAVQIGRTIRGTATKVRLMLEYADGAAQQHRLPPTMWLKAGLEAHSASEEMQAVYAGEALFYRDIAEGLDLGPPRAFASQIDSVTGRSFILLEDLLARHVTFGHATQPTSPDDAARTLELLAKLHARYWGSHALDRFDWLSHGGAFGRSKVHDWTYAPHLWERCAGLPRGRFMIGELGDRERMHGVMQRLLAYDIERAHCLVHGDAQLMNMYFTPDGEPGLLDWQNAMLGFWAHDVTEYTVTALTVADRRRSERDLIAHYVAALRRHGIDALDVETAWGEYVRHTAYTFHWTLCQPEWQPEPVCLQNSERACTAIMDHQSVGAW